MNTEDISAQWPPHDCPSLTWPTLSNEIERLNWYRDVIKAYSALWEGHVTEPHFSPVVETALAALEARLECSLPSAHPIPHNS